MNERTEGMDKDYSTVLFWVLHTVRHLAECTARLATIFNGQAEGDILLERKYNFLQNIHPLNA